MMQKPELSEDALKVAISTHLDAQARDISLTQRLRLDEARAAALSHARATASSSSGWFGFRTSAVLGACAALVFAVGMQFWGKVEREIDQEALLSMWDAEPLESAATLSPLDAAILADDDDAQVLDNLEFYAWLAEQQRAPSGS